MGDRPKPASRQSGQCLDVTGTTNPNGAGLELWPCNGLANQQWTLG
jgi:hypothetical protein